MSVAKVAELTLELDKAVAEYTPGEQISGTAQWKGLSEKTNKLSVRLIWYTQGKGDRDVDLASSLDFEMSPELLNNGERKFDFVAPSRPHSFSGKLIELTWAVEFIAYPSQDAVVEKLVIGPGGKATVLKRSYESALGRFGRAIAKKLGHSTASDEK